MTAVLHRVLQAHQWVYEKSGGLVGHTMLGVPCLLLRTTGRKSGLTRTSSLTYARDAGAYLVVASNGGADRPPGWLANLRANPDCEVQIGRRKLAVTARATLPDDPDYARRWGIVNSANKNRYAEYQKKTSRPIPIVELRPIS
jgi:deazaflavin-dependent oxidoreductase (nitroreductase family)